MKKNKNTNEKLALLLFVMAIINALVFGIAIYEFLKEPELMQSLASAISAKKTSALSLTYIILPVILTIEIVFNFIIFIFITNPKKQKN